MQPIAKVAGYHAGRCVIELTNPAKVLPTGLALYGAQEVKQGAVADARIAELLRAVADHVTVREEQAAEIAKRDERIAELEADQDKANAAVAIGNYLGKTYNYAWCDTSLASQTIDLLKEQAAEVSRLKALVGECEKKLRSIKTDVDSAPHIPISMTLNEIAFSVEEAIAAIKEEGL